MNNLDQLISRIIRREKRPRNLGATILWIEAICVGFIAGVVVMSIVVYLIIK